MSAPVKVSVLCITYNQKDYVRQALDGFMMQKTDFRFEVLVNDDASTDGTAEILQEYQKKYPDVIKLVLQPENQYSKGFRGMFTRILFPMARGQYMALCEGDDYWTDPLKLQTQVDYMDKHPGCTVCFHPVRIITEDGSHEELLYPDDKDTLRFTVEELLNSNYIQTNSVMYRRQNYDGIKTDIMPGDWYMHLYHAQFGNIGFIDKIMAVYRRHPGGIWWESWDNMEAIQRKHGVQWLGLYVAILEMYGERNKKYKDIATGSIIRQFSTLASIDAKYKSDLIERAISKYPEATDIYFRDLYKQVRTLEKHSNEQAKIIDHYVNLSNHQGTIIKALEDQVADLNARKLVRVGNAIRKVSRRRTGHAAN